MDNTERPRTGPGLSLGQDASASDAVGLCGCWNTQNRQCNRETDGDAYDAHVGERHRRAGWVACVRHFGGSAAAEGGVPAGKDIGALLVALRAYEFRCNER
jgi:hypothetical protein